MWNISIKFNKVKGEMTRKEITLYFDLENERDRRIFAGMKRLSQYGGESDYSKAFIRLMDDMLTSLVECEEKREECENMLNHFLGNEMRH